MAQCKAGKVQRRAGRPGFTGCRRRVGFADLPEEVLLRIFSFLRGPLLRPLRLVCRDFRQASTQHITGVRLAVGNGKGSVVNAIRSFPRIASLTIQARVPASVKKWPTSVGQLRSLTVQADAMKNGQLTGLISRLPGLTSLKLAWNNIECGPYPWLCGLRDITAHCPALRSLELEQCLVAWPSDFCASFLQLTALQELKLFSTPIVWSALLPRLTCLTLLRTLTCVCPERPGDFRALAALTQLTSLGGYMELPHWLDCLQALTGLKRVSLVFPGGGEPTDVLGPLIQLLPASLEGLCLLHKFYEMSAEDLRVLTGMTRLDHLEIGYTSPATHAALGRWSLEEANPWCSRLVGLRHLGLLGRPTGAPSVRLLAQHLALEHLRLRLELFDDVCHLSALTRLTLLHLYKETGEGTCARPLGPPRFLAPLQRLRHLSLHWQVRIGEERETVRCLAALGELERLHLTLVPLEQAEAEASPLLCSHVAADVSLESARFSCGRRLGELGETLTVSKPGRRKRNLGIQMLQPLVRMGSLSEFQVEGGYVVDRKTWERIQHLREGLGLPTLAPGSLLTKTGEFRANSLA